LPVLLPIEAKDSCGVFGARTPEWKTMLETLLSPYGFVLMFREEGRGAGGVFAWGEFVRGDRRLEVSIDWV
jgi:hypothetical protein